MMKKLCWAYWMARYWALDKYNPELRAFGFWASIVFSTVWALRMFVHATAPETPPKVQKGYFLIALLIILIVSLILSYALRPKPQNAQVQPGTQPTTKDGRALRRAFGTNWIDDSSMVGWVNGPPEPIKSSGGKK